MQRNLDHDDTISTTVADNKPYKQLFKSAIRFYHNNVSPTPSKLKDDKPFQRKKKFKTKI